MSKPQRHAVKLTALLLFCAGALSGATLKIKAGNRVVEAPLEQYVAAALAGEAAVFRSDEALKAMAVAARTYAIRMRGRHSKEGFDLCTTTHCQRADFDAITPRLQHVAEATAGEMLWYRGKLAFTPYSLDCGGRTEDAAAVWPDEAAPYLKSHADQYCIRAAASDWRWSAAAAALEAALQKQGLRAPAHLSAIRVSSRTASGRASELVLMGDSAEAIAASAFRFAIGRELGWNTLRSDSFDAQAAGGRIVFAGRGSGHGVGLCQRGADEMGSLGQSYREILAYYYPGTTPGASARGFEWTRLTGDHITLETTRPARDSSTLAAAGAALAAAAQRTGWVPPAGIVVRVYPDAAAFRDATGEPGWVAAYTHGKRIEMQPIEQLRNVEPTLRHELLHILIEAEAAPGIPLWFREGLTEYLSGVHSFGVVPTEKRLSELDEALRQTRNAVRARRAYDDASAEVEALAYRYGDPTLLRWVKSGIPSSAINPRTNNK
jgi:stage II sporulation protein D